MRRRVLVGMSGGVDSSVAAALLVSAGHEVIGISLQLYDHSGGGRAARCCSPEDFLDARRVAARLGIAYYVVNEEEAFGRRVLDYFVGEYRQGRTPNPCARCNAQVKFEALSRLARSLGATHVATGHYAGVREDPSTGRRRLVRAADEAKDQSYFLFDLTQEQLAMAIFPLGGLSKGHVRAEALRLGLATADKPESQDVCFVEGGDYRQFLARHAGGAPTGEPEGEFVDAGGAALGRHRGVSGYTVGQRRGLGISSGRRLYVVQVDAAANRVVLGDEQELMCAGLTVAGARYLPFDEPAGPFEASVRVRYRHAGAPARVTPLGGGRAEVGFRMPQRSVSPGQAAVFYDAEGVVGGGWIDGILRETARPARA